MLNREASMKPILYCYKYTDVLNEIYMIQLVSESPVIGTFHLSLAQYILADDASYIMVRQIHQIDDSFLLVFEQFKDCTD